MAVPRQFSLVRFDLRGVPARDIPLEDGKFYVFLGEIPNMPGHCVVADVPSGRVYSGFHTEHFTEVEHPDEGL